MRVIIKAYRLIPNFFPFIYQYDSMRVITKAYRLIPNFFPFI
jgi:hypothetical protein